ncbi:MAG: arginyltransferase [Alteromonadaceae bacterium]|nr:arginyltransferase [Alteromonadaceae bacterium]
MKFGVTSPFECSYLPGQKERLLVFVGHEDKNMPEQYESMLGNGFRRSGEQIYRPHCINCNACESLRIPVLWFKPSKSQKRILSKNKHWHVQISREDKPDYFSLYEKYINERHQDGGMFPPNKEQYEGFLFSSWASPLFIEFYDEDKLIAIAVTDDLPNCLSALYTFFDPDYEDYSLGTFAILRQIELAIELKKPFLYLGYQIDDCKKMNYKQKFLPNERFSDQSWQLFKK